MPILMTPAAAADEGQGVVAVFLVVAMVLVLAKLLGELFLRLGQPAVVGELIAGVILGPTFLHIVAAPIDGADAAEATIGVLANLGVLWLMFGAGLEVDLGDFRRAGRPASALRQPRRLSGILNQQQQSRLPTALLRLAVYRVHA